MLKNKVIVLESASYDKSNYWVPIEKNGIINNFTEVLANVDLSIRPAASDSLVLTTVKTASGTFETSAFNSARNIKYSYRIKDSLIIIEPYFKFSKKEGMHFQKAEFIIAIPVNTEIQIDEKLCEMLNDEDFTGEDNSGGKYLMTNTGLKKLLTK